GITRHLCQGCGNQRKIEQRAIGCSHEIAVADPALACDRLKIVLLCRSENDSPFDGKHGGRRSSGDAFRASVCQSATDCEQKSKCRKTHQQSMVCPRPHCPVFRFQISNTGQLTREVFATFGDITMCLTTLQAPPGTGKTLSLRYRV